MKVTKLALAIAITTAMLAQFASPVSAETEQQQKQSLEVICEVGAYGQAVNCRVKGEQEQIQKTDRVIVYRDGKVVEKHNVVDTGVETPIALFGGLVMTVGAAAMLAKARK